MFTLSLLIRPVWPSTYEELVSPSKKKVLDPLSVFFALFRCVCVCGMCVWGGGGGLPRGQGHNLLMQFSSLGSKEMEISETDFLIFLPSEMTKYPM